MSGLSDFSLIDIINIFDNKDGPNKFECKDDIKLEDKHTNEYWDNTGDDFLNEILNSQNLDILPEDDLLIQQAQITNVSGSVCSDSGLSSDQQLSPLSFQDCIEDQDSNSLSTDVSVDPVTLLSADFDFRAERVETKVKANQTEVIDKKPIVRVKPTVSRNSKIVNLTSIQQNNPRSILIPMKSRNGLKTIKIIKAARNITKTIPTIKVEPKYDDARSSSDDTGDEAEQNSSIYPRLKLTEEEKRLMIKEGISLPSHYPLTKQEERDLKRIRRKIRNKISAQDSRKRKKEYVDGLEDRVKQCSVENATLIKRVKALQNENQSLSQQLKKLQAVIAKTPAQQAQPATCLMVIVLSLALICAPNMRNNTKSTPNGIIPETKSNPIAGRTRTLLEVPKQLDNFLEPPLDGVVKDEPIENIANEEIIIKEEEEDGVIFSELAELLHFRSSPSQHDHDYTNPRIRKRSRAFLVPPVDDNWPPPKRLFSPQKIEYHTLDKNKTRPESPSNIVEIELSSSEEIGE